MAGGEGPEGHYYVFDLDETLGQMYSFFYYMCTLRPDAHQPELQPQKKAAVLSNARFRDLQERLDIAYRAFVRLIAEKETSAEPLGLLRPGILEVFRAIQAQKDRGQNVCCMIYSNNGSLFLLELTRDVIHTALGVDKLIQDCVHWYHPTRKPEIDAGVPGSARKTWRVLSKLLQEGGCGAPESIRPDQVTFFDDRIHFNLKQILKDNSIKVIPYHYKAPYAKINTLYTEALREAGFFDTEELTQKLLQLIDTHCATAKNDNGPFTWGKHLAAIAKFSGKANADASVPPARLADTDALVAAVTKNNVAVINAVANAVVNNGIGLGNNPLSSIQSNVFTGGKGRILRRRVLTRRKRSGIVRKKTRHIRRRR